MGVGQNSGIKGVSSEAQCMDFCLNAGPDASCMAATYFRGVCYTKNVAALQANVVAASDENTLVWCEDGAISSF